MRLALRTRVAVAGALAAAAAVTGTAAVAYVVVDHELRRSLDLELSRDVTRLGRTTGWSPEGPCQFLAAPLCEQKITDSGATGSPLPISAESRQVLAGQRESFYSDAVFEGQPVRMLTAPLPQGGVVQVAARADRIEESLHRIGLALLLAGSVGVALAALAGFLVARTGLKPVRELTRTAREVAATRDPARRIEVGGHDELASLGASMNVMLAELQAASQAQRRLVADASHELRTPLTSLRTNIDLLDQLDPEQRAEVMAALRAQAAELTGLIGDLTELARDEPPQEEPEPLRLDLLVARCVHAARRNWPAITFTADLDQTTVDGVPPRLSRAVANLLDNAAKFSPGNGTVEVSLHDRELRVRDHGPGIPAEDLPHVFDRFYRADSARGLPGSGLGLAIVSQVAARHGGTVTVRCPPGGGTLITLRL
ncbi:hypothetical protein GCM10010174_41780 [Kutzneria viridogrisea]|uniref:histidine kinase n=1 Tax=Kutzneria viridogrisea TaxID=47990 RepID=A0ABR6BT91_9PSEU|nr:two-component system sensor histidine kinase MprB [Kutzneria viridogrisea]